MNASNREPDMVIVGYLTVLGRALLHAPLLFYSVVDDSTTRSSGASSRQVLVAIVDILMTMYYSTVYNSSGSIRRKVWMCALCNLLMTKNEEILERFGQVLDICADALDETKDTEVIFAATYDKTELGRKAMLVESDLVRHISRYGHISPCLAGGAGQCSRVRSEYLDCFDGANRSCCVKPHLFASRPVCFSSFSIIIIANKHTC